MNEITVRLARPDDCETIVDFNAKLATETENKVLNFDLLLPGVRALLADPAKGRYFVACDGDQIVGQVMHTREWSDWRNGDIWWLQSVYVAAPYRRAGVFRKLYNHLQDEAKRDPTVVGLRLYVEENNHRAQETYRAFGMVEGGYFVLERFFER